MNATSMKSLAVTLTIGIAAAGVGVLDTAFAADTDLPTQVVRYGDLNIDNPLGAQTLYRRIQAAAWEVCGGRTDLRALAVQQHCLKQAIDNAVLGVHSAVLSELRFGKDIHLASR